MRLRFRRKKTVEQTSTGPSSCTLDQLCKKVISCISSFEDVAEEIENKSFLLCEQGNLSEAMIRLNELATFFEQLPNKNDEHIHDLADLYILIGEVYQYSGDFTESILWFQKAIIVHVRYPVPYHSLAASYIELHELDKAIACLEQELVVAPGNYFSYLRLSELYEQTGKLNKKEECLKNLLIRDPDNMTALHRLIVFYEKHQPEADVELLRRRLIGVHKKFNRMELQIWICTMCKQGRTADAIVYLQQSEQELSHDPLYHLLKAHLFGLEHNFSWKRKELTLYLQKNRGRENHIRSELHEFEEIFGKKAAEKLGQRMIINNPMR